MGVKNVRAVDNSSGLPTGGHCRLPLDSSEYERLMANFPVYELKELDFNVTKITQSRMKKQRTIRLTSRGIENIRRAEEEGILTKFHLYPQVVAAVANPSGCLIMFSTGTTYNLVTQDGLDLALELHLRREMTALASPVGGLAESSAHIKPLEQDTQPVPPQCRLDVIPIPPRSDDNLNLPPTPPSFDLGTNVTSPHTEDLLGSVGSSDIEAFQHERVVAPFFGDPATAPADIRSNSSGRAPPQLPTIMSPFTTAWLKNNTLQCVLRMLLGAHDPVRQALMRFLRLEHPRQFEGLGRQCRDVIDQMQNFIIQLPSFQSQMKEPVSCFVNAADTSLTDNDISFRRFTATETIRKAVSSAVEQLILPLNMAPVIIDAAQATFGLRDYFIRKAVSALRSGAHLFPTLKSELVPPDRWQHSVSLLQRLTTDRASNVPPRQLILLISAAIVYIDRDTRLHSPAAQAAMMQHRTLERLSMDDIMPILVFCVARAGITHPFVILHYIDAIAHDDASYTVMNLRAAVTQLLNEAQSVARNAERECTPDAEGARIAVEIYLPELHKPLTRETLSTLCKRLVYSFLDYDPDSWYSLDIFVLEGTDCGTISTSLLPLVDLDDPRTRPTHVRLHTLTDSELSIDDRTPLTVRVLVPDVMASLCGDFKTVAEEALTTDTDLEPVDIDVLVLAPASERNMTTQCPLRKRACSDRYGEEQRRSTCQ